MRAPAALSAGRDARTVLGRDRQDAAEGGFERPELERHEFLDVLEDALGDPSYAAASSEPESKLEGPNRITRRVRERPERPDRPDRSQDVSAVHD